MRSPPVLNPKAGMWIGYEAKGQWNGDGDVGEVVVGAKAPLTLALSPRVGRVWMYLSLPSGLAEVGEVLSTALAG